MMKPILPPLRAGAEDADVPTDLVPPDDRSAVAAIVRDPTIVQPLVVRRLEAPVATFERLLADLPRTAGLVDGLGLGRYAIGHRADGTVAIEDGYGAWARVACLVEREGARVYRATGGFDIFPVPPLHGTGIVTLRYEPDGPAALKTGGQIYFRLDNRFLHLLARPLVRLLHRVIDGKVQALVSAAMAACEHEAREEVARAGRR